MRDSVNISTQEKRKPLVAISNLATLADFELTLSYAKEISEVVKIATKYAPAVFNINSAIAGPHSI